MVYGDFKDFTRRNATDKVLHDKAFNITKKLKYDGYQRGSISLVYKFFNKKASGRVAVLARSETLLSENHPSYAK